MPASPASGHGKEAPNMGRLAGKVALVTGAGSGIGRAIAVGFGREGAKVALSGRSEGPLRAVAEEIGADALALPGDVRDAAAVRAMVDAVVERFGRLDILVNNAGVGLVRPTEELELAEWQRVIDTNLTGPFLCAQAAGRVMLGQGSGRILNIASLTSKTGLPMRAAYGASKGGIMAFTQSLAVEWGPRGLRVNAIAPGFIRTALQDDLVKRGLFPKDRIVARTPNRRMGTPEDVAAAAIFLASDEADWVNGETFVVDGGWLANGWVE
jgi:NAD(P)-dependent dehydrogenase (short-subunit alcohol dehydrogenase family)